MTMENCSALCNVSPPLPRESICSWISRISLSQGVSITAMLEFLEVKLHIDFDFRFWRLDIDQSPRKQVSRFLTSRINELFPSPYVYIPTIQTIM